MKMIKNIIRKLVSWGVEYLNKDGFNYYLAEVNDKEFESNVIDQSENQQLLWQLTNDISIKRAEISEELKNLVLSIEPSYFDLISKFGSDREKTTLTKIYLDKTNKVTKLFGEHENLIKQFESVYYEIEKNSNYNEI